MDKKTSRILLIEDNPGDAGLVVQMLADVWYCRDQITVAETLAKGIRHLDGEGIDIVLLDLNLPDSNGVDTFTRIVEHSSKVPVLVLTGTTDDQIALNVMHAGSQDYLKKGEIDAPVLRFAITKAMSRHEALQIIEKRAQEIAEEERRLRSLISENADAVMVVDEKGIVQFANPAAEVLFDKPSGSLVSGSFGYPVSGARVAEIDVTVTGGRTALVEMRAAPVQWEGESSFLITLRDITQRKEVEEALRQSESLMRSLISSVKDAIIAIDENGIVSMFNPAAEEMFGHRASDVIGGPLDPLMPADYRGRHARHLQSYFAEGQPDGAIGKLIELPAERSSGELFTMEISLAASKCGGKSFVVGVARDISERKRAESALKQANRKLRELDQLKSDFLSTTSHELRTPLTIISEFASILHDGIAGLLSDEQEEWVESILNNTKRLGALINDILDLQRMESGRLKLTRKNCDLAGLLRQIVHDFEPTFESKEQKLTLKATNELPRALCDPSKITQVMVNLVGNAHKFTPSQGSVTVSAGRIGDSIRVDVADTGPGITEDEQEHVFARFTQLKREDGPGYKGTGLGLAIARDIVELHGGEMSLRSTKGSGSTFSFTIPVYTDTGAAQALIQDRLATARVSGDVVSLALVRLEPYAEALPDEGFRENVLAEAVKCIQACFRREDDQVLEMGSERTLLILCESDDCGINALMQRAFRSLAQDLHSDAQLHYSTMTIEPDVEEQDWLEQAIAQLTLLDLKTCGRQILVVDDDENLVRVVCKALTTSDMHLTVEASTDGYEACIKVGKMVPDLVVLDACLPNHDGREVLKLIKNSPHTSGALVLAISGGKERLTEMADLGADGCLLKPFTPQALLNEVKSLLRTPTARRAVSLEAVES